MEMLIYPILVTANSALTAQPTLELHTHGSPALISLLLQLLPTLGDDFRIAEPGPFSTIHSLSEMSSEIRVVSIGEFTRLAFEAGKLDLTEVEGIRDLVESDTESQRKLAARQAGVRRLSIVLCGVFMMS